MTKLIISIILSVCLFTNGYFYINNITELEEETRITFEKVSSFVKSHQSNLKGIKFIIKSLKDNIKNCVYFRIFLILLSGFFVLFYEEIGFIFAIQEFLLFLFTSSFDFDNENYLIYFTLKILIFLIFSIDIYFIRKRTYEVTEIKDKIE